MFIYSATNTLDGYLPQLNVTNDKSLAEVVLIGGKPLSLQEFPRLRGIFKTGIGTDNLPFEEAESRGVVIELPSEHAIMTILDETASYTCNLILHGSYTNVGTWDTWHKIDRPALANQNLLVIGHGRIGKRVVKRMQPFMKVDTFDLAENSQGELEPKLRLADAVCLMVPLDSTTRGFFNSEKLKWMKDGALLVNTARGSIVDEDALYTELANKRLRAAFDVFWSEPYNGKLCQLDSETFVRTPHVASTCREFLQLTARDFLLFLENLKRSGNRND